MSHPHYIAVVEPAGLLYGSEFCLLDVLTGLDRERFTSEVLLPKGAPFRERLDADQLDWSEALPADLMQCGRLRRLLAYQRLESRWRSQPPNLIYVNQAGILRPIARIAQRLQLPSAGGPPK